MKSPMNYVQAEWPACVICLDEENHRDNFCTRAKCQEEIKFIILHGAHTIFKDSRHDYHLASETIVTPVQTCFSRFIDHGTRNTEEIASQAAAHMITWVSAGMVQELVQMHDNRTIGRSFSIHKGTIAAIAAGFLAFCQLNETHTITNWLSDNEADFPGLYEYANRIKIGTRFMHYIDAESFLGYYHVGKARIMKRFELRQIFLSANTNITVPDIQKICSEPGMNKIINMHYWLTEREDIAHTIHFLDDPIDGDE